MRFVIVTGMSGAGKSTVFNLLEDSGYFCVDNLPISLIPTFMQLTLDSSERIEKVALGLDIRSGEALTQVGEVLDDMKAKGFVYEILFMDCSTPILMKRFKETRRVHPLADGGRYDTIIEEERKKMSDLKKRADVIIDTSRLLVRDLKSEVDRIFVGEESYHKLFLTFVSFGFKYGAPSDADLVFDVRFLPNPYYVDELKMLTGNDKEVNDYVMKSDKAEIFLGKLKDMLEFLIPNYVIEGKHQLVVAVGCTGGKHRSVTIANNLYDYFKNSEYGCKKEHRDIEKDRSKGICRFQEK